jgi:MFS family permease
MHVAATPPPPSPPLPSSTAGRSARALEAASFFLADVQAGVGPFLGVYLQAHHWAPGRIGTAMTAGGLVALAATMPAGALVDGTRHKRGVIAIASAATILATCIVLLSTTFPMVVASQVLTALAGAVFGPALAGVTLGMVGQERFDRQFGRLQVANHSGNVVAAGVSGWLGWYFGFTAIFALAAAFGVLAVASTYCIARHDIDDRRARGLAQRAHEAAAAEDAPGAIGVLWQCRPLLLLATVLCFFHLGNAAMLPLYGLAVVGQGRVDPALFTSATIVIAQLTMVGASVLAMRWIRTRGHAWVILMTLLVLPIRGVIAAFWADAWGVIPVQVLDGVGAGLQSVAVPAFVAHLMNGTGRVNVAQGGVLAVQGLGAALSPALGGWLAEIHGYRTSFLSLGALAAVAVALWWPAARRMPAPSPLPTAIS